MSDDLNVKIGASSAGLQAGLDGAAASVQGAQAKIAALLERLNSSFDGVATHIKKLNSTPMTTPVTPEHLAGIGGLKSHLEGLQGTVGSLVGKFNAVGAAITAIAAGGAFAGFIKSFINEAGEVGKLSSRLSITTEEASHLNVALGLLGSSSDEYLHTTDMLNRQIRTNGDRMAELGVHTKDASGKQLTQQEIMQSGLAVLDKYAAGYDRNMVSMELFGRSADEAQKFGKLNNAMMEKATALAKAYGNEFSKEAITATKEFKVAVGTVSFAVEQFGQAIGEKMMPYVQKTADWFSNEGPAAFALFGEALDGLFGLYDSVRGFVGDVFESLGGALSDVMGIINGALDSLGLATDRAITGGELIRNVFTVIRIALEVLKLGFLEVLEAIIGTFTLWYGKIMAIGDAVATFFSDGFNVKSAKAVWDARFAEIEKRAEEHGRKMADLALKSAAVIDGLLNGSAPEKSESKKAAPTAPAGSAKYTPKGDGKGGSAEDLIKGRLAVTKAGLEAELALQKQLLAEQLAGDEDAHKNNLLSLSAYYGERLRIAQEGLQLELNAKKQELAGARAAESDPKVKNEKERLALVASRIKLEGEVAVLERKFTDAAIQNARERIAAERALNKQLADIRIEATVAAGQALIAHDESLTNQRLSLAQISAGDALSAAKGFEDRRYAIAAEAQAKRLALTNGDVVAQAKIFADIEKMDADHQQKMLELEIQVTAERRKAVTQSMADTRTSLEANLNGILNGTKTVLGGIKGLLKDVHASILKGLAQQGADAGMKLLGGKDGTGLSTLFGSVLGGGKTKDGMPLDSAKNALRVTNVDGGLGGDATWADSPFAPLMDGLRDAFDQVKKSLSTVFDSLASSLSSVFSSMSGGGGGGGGWGSALGSIFGSMASFDVGTDAVPRDMLALVHAGERITPAKYTGKSEGGDRTVHNHFAITGPVDARTQQQLALAAGSMTQRAMARGA